MSNSKWGGLVTFLIGMITILLTVIVALVAEGAHSLNQTTLEIKDVLAVHEKRIDHLERETGYSMYDKGGQNDREN